MLFDPVAQLLCQGDCNRQLKEDCDLLKERHPCQRRDNVRLQIPHRGREDPLSLWCTALSWYLELAGTPDLNVSMSAPL